MAPAGMPVLKTPERKQELYNLYYVKYKIFVLVS